MNTRKMVMTSLFIALGIIVPQAFHMFGGPGVGQVFLPMHYPVIIAGMILGPLSGAIVGVMSVLVGMMLGMPAVHIGMFMIFELMTYGLVSGMTYKNFPLMISLGLTMLAGRVVSLVLINVAIGLFQVNLPPIFGQVAMFTVSIPGMIVQLILIPIIIVSLKERYRKRL